MSVCREIAKPRAEVVAADCRHAETFQRADKAEAERDAAIAVIAELRNEVERAVAINLRLNERCMRLEGASYPMKKMGAV
tara:strand:+ start:2414 stop:2653 length:240 start_codon:yes stop_codon:yes gene_type:complete